MNLFFKLFLSYFITCICFTALFSQISVKQNDININNNIEIYYLKAKKFYPSSIDSALKYTELGYSLIDENHGKKQKNNYLLMLGSCYQRLNEYKIALKYLQQAYEGFENDKNKNKLLTTVFSMGNVYAKTSYYNKALFYFQKTFYLSIEVKDTMQQCNSLINSGTVYYIMKEYQSALKMYKNALILANRFHSELTIANIFRNISNLYADLNDLKTALLYQMQALEIYKKINNKYYLAIVNTDIGYDYKKLNKNKLALSYFENAYKLVRNLNAKTLESHILYNIGSIYQSTNQLDKAKTYLENAEKIAVNVEDKLTLSNIYEAFGNYYEAQKEYKKALDYYKRYKVTNDSIYSKESSDKIAELQVKFDIQEKERENQILIQKNEIQKLDIHKQIYLRNTFIILTILITVLVIFVLSRFYIKKKANNMLSEKNQQISIQKLQLEEAFDTKDKILAVITHDLNNPFGSLVSLVSFLESNYYKLEEDHKYKGIESLKKSIVEIYYLLENLTSWVNSKANAVTLNINNFDLYESVLSVFSLYKNVVEQKSIDMQIYVNPNTFVLADERMIKTVLRNLIDNATKFTPFNGNIHVKATEEKNKVILSVADSGKGMKEEVKSSLFKSDSQHLTGGGLGLILSKEFIDKNGGELWVESEEGKGSIFYFSLNKSDFYEEN